MTNMSDVTMNIMSSKKHDVLQKEVSTTASNSSFYMEKKFLNQKSGNSEWRNYCEKKEEEVFEKIEETMPIIFECCLEFDQEGKFYEKDFYMKFISVCQDVMEELLIIKNHIESDEYYAVILEDLEDQMKTQHFRIQFPFCKIAQYWLLGSATVLLIAVINKPRLGY